MKTVLALSLLVTGCSASASVDPDASSDGGVFDCDIACAIEVACVDMVDDVHPADVGACVVSCEESLAQLSTSAQETAAECLWEECVGGYGTGAVGCDDWLTCCQHCTDVLFE